MPIPINGISDSALAALASKNVPNLNLPLFGVKSPLEGQGLGMLERAKLQEQYDALAQMQQIQQMQEQGMFKRQELSNQGQMAYGQQQNLFNAVENDKSRQMEAAKIAAMAQAQQQERLFQQAHLAQTGAYQQAQLGLQQGQLGLGVAQMQQQKELEMAKLRQEAAKMDFEQKLKMDEVTLHQQAGGIAGIMLGMQMESDPTKKLEIAKSGAEFLHNAGKLDDNAYNMVQKATDYRQLMALGAQSIMTSGVAAGSKDSSGIAPMMGAMFPTQQLTTTQQNEAQGAISAATTQQQKVGELSDIINKNPDIFTYWGQLKGGISEKGEKSPVIASIAKGLGMDMTKAQELDDAQTRFEQIAGDLRLGIINSAKGVRLAEVSQRFLDTIVPTTEDSATNAKLKAAYLQKMYSDVIALNKSYLSGGMPVRDYEKALNSTIESTKKEYESSTSSSSWVHPTRGILTEENVRETAKEYGVSEDVIREEFTKRFGVK